MLQQQDDLRSNAKNVQTDYGWDVIVSQYPFRISRDGFGTPCSTKPNNHQEVYATPVLRHQVHAERWLEHTGKKILLCLHKSVHSDPRVNHWQVSYSWHGKTLWKIKMPPAGTMQSSFLQHLEPTCATYWKMLKLSKFSVSSCQWQLGGAKKCST